MTTGVLWLVLSLLFQGAAAFFSKKAALGMSGFSLIGIIGNPFYLLALTCLGLQVVSWSLVLRRIPLFQAFLAMSLIYPIILCIGAIGFDEGVRSQEIIGVVMIMAGVILMNARSPERAVG